MLEELKQKVEAKGYLCEILDGELTILFRNGHLNSKGQAGRSIVGKLYEEEGKILLTEMFAPFGRTTELRNINEVIEFLLKRYPNLEIGEELPEFDD